MPARGYVDGLFGQVHYHRTRTEPLRFAMFHESPLRARTFDAVLDALDAAGGPGAVAFDTPGYGSSDPPPRAGPIEIYADAMLDAIAKLGIDGVTLVGVHTGAAIAISAAAHAQDGLVHSLVLSGVCAIAPERRAELVASWAPQMTPADDGGHLDWTWERYERIYGRQTPVEMRHAAVADLLACLERYEWAYDAALRYDPLPDLAALDLPVLLLTPEHDILADGDGHVLASGLATEQQVFPGLAGQLPLRDPAGFAAALRGWLGTSAKETGGWPRNDQIRDVSRPPSPGAAMT